MKQIITIMLAILLIVVMAVPAAAVTPSLNTPSITVLDITDSVRKNLDEYHIEITIDPTEEPTEPPTELPEEDSNDAVKSSTVVFEWNYWLYQLWNRLIH